MNHPNTMTLNQAAKACNRSKGTISKALKDGKLSYLSKDDSGYKIDPSELFRVFPLNTFDTEQKNRLETPVEQQSDGQKNRELGLELKHALELLRMERESHAETKAEKSKLLDIVESQTHLLKHRREEEEKPVGRQQGFWAALLGKRS